MSSTASPGPSGTACQGLAFGLAAHHLTGFSAGGVALLATMAGSRSDVS